MLTKQEIEEVIEKSQEDGARLYNVSEAIYKIILIFNWIVGIVGGLISLYLFYQAHDTPLLGGEVYIIPTVILLATALICVSIYTIAVLSTHVAKVLVHILFTNIVNIAEKENEPIPK